MGIGDEIRAGHLLRHTIPFLIPHFFLHSQILDFFSLAFLLIVTHPIRWLLHNSRPKVLSLFKKKVSIATEG